MKLSVLLAVYNYPLVDLCLHSFTRQTEKDFEVCITNDGGEEGYIIPIIKKYENKLNLVYQYLHPPSEVFRVGHARNLSANVARGDRFAITDSDCLVCPDFVSQHSNRTGVYAGMRRHIPITHVPLLTETSLDGEIPYREDQRIIVTHSSMTNWELSRFCWGCNVSYDAVKYRKIGGFDEWFVEWGSEDVELALRMYQIGEQFVMDRDFYVYHMDHPIRANGASIRQYMNKTRYDDQLVNCDFVI